VSCKSCHAEILPAANAFRVPERGPRCSRTSKGQRTVAALCISLIAVLEDPAAPFHQDNVTPEIIHLA